MIPVLHLSMMMIENLHWMADSMFREHKYPPAMETRERAQILDKEVLVSNPATVTNFSILDKTMNVQSWGH